MRKKRTAVQISYEILRLCQKGPCSKTFIVYKTNMNFKTAQIYLANLEARGLLDRGVDGWITTEKGKKCNKIVRNTRLGGLDIISLNKTINQFAIWVHACEEFKDEINQRVTF